MAYAKFGPICCDFGKFPKYEIFWTPTHNYIFQVTQFFFKQKLFLKVSSLINAMCNFSKLLTVFVKLFFKITYVKKHDFLENGTTFFL